MLGQILFARVMEGNVSMHEMKYNLESRLSDTVNCLTIEQRCAEWFTLRQSRITGIIHMHI